MVSQQVIDISVVIPVYNEENTLIELYDQLSTCLNQSGKQYEIIFVNDGSQDNSLILLKEIYQKNQKHVCVINFSRNFGHQLAITAGINHARGKAAVIMDADLQDPPEVIIQFIEQWDRGFDVVYGKRKEREGESFFKKFTASLFYKIIRRSTAIDIPENVGDFYLLDRKVVNIINSLTERHRFMRGLVAWVGFKRVGVDYVRKSRYAGETKYGFWRMVKFSFDAMTSFSFLPLRIVSTLGAIISFISFLAILLIIYMKLFTDATIIGWSSIMAAVLFIGGVQLLAIGIIGEYIARIGDDVKARPLYTIEEILN